MRFDAKSKILFAELITAAMDLENVWPAKELENRMWIHFEWFPQAGIWRALPSGLAIIGKYGDPESALAPFYKLFVECGFSYQTAGEILTGIPGELMTQGNRVYGRGQFSLEGMITTLLSDGLLEPESVGPRIIDAISDPGA